MLHSIPIINENLKNITRQSMVSQSLLLMGTLSWWEQLEPLVRLSTSPT